MTRRLGGNAKLAKEIGRAHEYNGLQPGATRRLRRRTRMDLHNNSFGANFAAHRPAMNDRQLCQGILDRLRSGIVKGEGPRPLSRLYYLYDRHRVTKRGVRPTGARC